MDTTRWVLLACLVLPGAGEASEHGIDHYICYRTVGPITVDGKLDEPSWEEAPWSLPLVHIVTGERAPAEYETRVALLWDDTYLYFGFDVTEVDVWGTITERDTRGFSQDNDVEVFIAGKDAYYELEMNALNTIYEVFWIWGDGLLAGSTYDVPEWDPETQNGEYSVGRPYGPTWGYWWDFPGFLHAVHVDGTLNEPDDVDVKWTVELAFPWQGMEWLAYGRSLPPESGDVWRIDVSRFEQGVPPEVGQGCAGWTWSKHGLCQSHMPETFAYVHMSTETPHAAPEVVSFRVAPAAARVGKSTSLELTVVLTEPLEATGVFTQMSVDLSAIGLAGMYPLRHEGAGQYTLRASITPPRTGQHVLPVALVVADGGQASLLRVGLDVYPAEDLPIYDEGPAEGWSVEVLGAESNTEATAFVHTGSFSHAILLPTMVTYAFDDPEGVDLFGYTHLEFWINGGGGTGQDPRIDGRKLSNWGVVVEPNTWKKVSIPASEFPDPLTSFYVGGVRQDRFYVDDMKLVAAEVELPPTAVEEAASTSAVPVGYALFGNYPNPFNAQTTIRYAVPVRSGVLLEVFSLSGQRIRTLVDDVRPAARYTIVWDGKDPQGRDVASGVYACRFQADGAAAQTTRMVLLK